MKRLLAAMTLVLGVAASAQAVPVLQVGAPGGAGEGTYADYQANTSNPTESDTAITSGGTLYVAGVYQNQNVLNLGGKYGAGLDWSSFGLPTTFDGKGAILVVSVPNGVTGTLNITGATQFATSPTIGGFFPNNHDPLKDNVSDFLFFDIGTFAKLTGVVPDFDPETGAADGQIKTLTGITVTGYDWLHFDVMALETLDKIDKPATNLKTSWENNPGSHDVTWKNDGGGPPAETVPEPGTMALVGLGLAALGLYHRKRRS